MESVRVIDGVGGCPPIYTYPDLQFGIELLPGAAWSVAAVQAAANATLRATQCRVETDGDRTRLTWTCIGSDPAPNKDFLRGQLSEQVQALIERLATLEAGA